MRNILITGFVAWLLATILFRVAGQWFFYPEDSLLMGFLFAAAVPLMVGLCELVYRYFKIERSQRPLGAVCLATPVILDALTVWCFPIVFPNLPATGNVPFAALMLWGYGIVIATGLIPGKEGQVS